MVEFVFKLLMYAVPMFFAIVLHEMSHGFIALLLGDDTAKRMNRFKLYTHFDLFGSFILPLSLYLLHFPFMIGYAKPVPVDIRKFKDPLLDFALVAVAGPACNFILAFCSLFTIKICPHLPSLIIHMLAVFSMTNLGLGFFNLIPIPPLDGSRIVTCMLPQELAFKYIRLERFGIFIIFGLEYVSRSICHTFGVNSSLFDFFIHRPVTGVIEAMMY